LKKRKKNICFYWN